MVKLAELIRNGSEELHDAIILLRNPKNINKINEHCVKINSIENYADDVFDMSIGSLFDEEKDAIKIIKIKDILETLETATDLCEDAADTIRAIVIKQA